MGDMFISFLNISITASYIILAVVLFRALFKKIPKKFICALWAIAGLRLIFPFSIESIFSLIPSAKTIDPSPAYGVEFNSGFSEIDTQVNNYLIQAEMQSTDVIPNLGEIIKNGAALLWIIGVAVLLTYCIISYIKIRRSVSTAIILRDNIYQCEKVTSPFILGIIKPKIYIPFNMDEATQSHVIAHEKAHLRRRDHFIKPLGFLILTVHWFNPFVWLAYVLLCRDIESACDEKVIAEMNGETRKEYASALLSCAVNRRRIAACPLAFGEVSVKERVKSVMSYKKPAFWIILISIIACFVASVCFLTNPPQKEFYDPGTRLVIKIAENGVQVESKVLIPQIGEKVKLENGTKVKITVPNLQTGEVEVELSGTPIFNEYNKSPGNIVISENADPMVFTDDNSHTISFVYTTIAQTAEQAITKEIMKHNHGKYMIGEYQCEAHDILANETGSPADGKGGKETVTYYMIAEYGEFNFDGYTPIHISGGRSPVALTFEIDESGYTLIEYWEASDGSMHVDSVKEKFPGSAATEAMNYKSNLYEKLLEQATDYISGATYPHTLPESDYLNEIYYSTYYNTVFLKNGEKDHLREGYNKAHQYFDSNQNRMSFFIEFTEETPPIPGILVNSREEFDKLLKDMNGLFSFDIPENVSSDSFLETATQFDEYFFEHKSLYVMYLNEKSSSISHELSQIRKASPIEPDSDNPLSYYLSFNVHRLIPPKCDSVESHKLISIAFDKSVTDESYNIIVCRGKDYDGNGGSKYTYKGTDESSLIYATLTLKNDSEAQFMYSMLSSYIAIGTYTLDDNELILKTDDDLYSYTFKVEGNTFVFDESKSSPLPIYNYGDGTKFTPVPDGAVFR